MSHKIALIGTGMVGMSFAYASTIQGLYSELVLIDIDKERAQGEAFDLHNAIPFLSNPMRVYAGDYSDCSDADVVVIPAGFPQLPGETRLDLAHKNTKVMRSIIKELMSSGFKGIIVVASNPVDILTYIAMEESGLPKNQVFGTGTLLDSGRFRQVLAEKLNVSPFSMHAHIIGEHGDSSIPAFSSANIAGKSLYKFIEEKKISQKILDDAYIYARDAAYTIIKKKRATYYGIGAALAKIVRAIFNNERTVLTVGAYLDGEYGQKDIYIGVPAVIGKEGVCEVVEISLSLEEKEKFDKSCDVLREVRKSIT